MCENWRGANFNGNKVCMCKQSMEYTKHAYMLNCHPFIVCIVCNFNTYVDAFKEDSLKVQLIWRESEVEPRFTRASNQLIVIQKHVYILLFRMHPQWHLKCRTPVRLQCLCNIYMENIEFKRHTLILCLAEVHVNLHSLWTWACNSAIRTCEFCLENNVSFSYKKSSRMELFTLQYNV